jgi:hypothetical protein
MKIITKKYLPTLYKNFSERKINAYQIFDEIDYPNWRWKI